MSYFQKFEMVVSLVLLLLHILHMGPTIHTFAQRLGYKPHASMPYVVLYLHYVLDIFPVLPILPPLMFFSIYNSTKGRHLAIGELLLPVASSSCAIPHCHSCALDIWPWGHFLLVIPNMHCDVRMRRNLWHWAASMVKHPGSIWTFFNQAHKNLELSPTCLNWCYRCL